MGSQNGEIVTAEDREFTRFDVIGEDPADHYYFKPSKGSGGGRGDRFNGGAPSSEVSKNIMREWKLLDKNLPESIFVRVYETRIFLLRAAIVGAAGTPYHDGLFFFDIAFPSDYPTRPPLVHYRSCGYRINPNLYANGKVCLSLINTWSGNKTEKWDRNRSTILQILLSIQALVLNEKPYFNEPGYGSSKGRSYWEKKSSAYNQHVFVLCCKTALCLLRNPPQNFETLVCLHFRNQAGAILGACNSYMTGGGMGKVGVSVKLKGEMEKVYGDLVAALVINGGPVGNLVEQLALQAEARTKAAAADETKLGKLKVKKKKKKGFSIVRVLGKLKKIWMGMDMGVGSSKNDEASSEFQHQHFRC